jgi:hypothetical protein
MRATVETLRPGQVVSIPELGLSATFVQQAPHPIWPNLRLVIWKMADGSWSHDALDPRQDVGEIEPATPEALLANLRAALLGGGA